MVKRNSEPATLGKGLRVRGRVRGDGDLRVDAQVEGDISVSGALELGSESQVTGAVTAASLHLAGALEGDVKSDGIVTVAAGARMRGDVQAAGFSLDEGASFEGRVEADFELPDAIA
jgi:cytoskeletal protein CcmA (bactofilin family)